MVNIPAGLLQAVTADGGGHLALVIGAGCSVEPPTCIPAGRRLALQAAERLVLDGVLSPGECADPSDLAALASLIFQKNGNQRDLVSRLPIQDMKLAKANTGHRLLVALMCETAISFVISLNFDLAVQNAASELGIAIHSIENSGSALPGPPAIVQLHGSAYGGSEDLILRREVIDDDWRGRWGNVLANQILAAPNVLFVGLGSAAPVITETIWMIESALAGAVTYYQADLIPYGDNDFAAQLGIPSDRYILGGWCAVLTALSHRVVLLQVGLIIQAGRRLLADENALNDEVERFAMFVEQLKDWSILTIGQMRAFARLDERCGYFPRSLDSDELVAQQIAILARVCFANGISAHPTGGGLWQLEGAGGFRRIALLGSGRGVRSKLAIEPIVVRICYAVRERSNGGPDCILLSGVSSDLVVPENVDIIGDDGIDDVITGPGRPRIFLTGHAGVAEQIGQWCDVA